jgi:hypothetical protein
VTAFVVHPAIARSATAFAVCCLFAAVAALIVWGAGGLRPIDDIDVIVEGRWLRSTPEPSSILLQPPLYDQDADQEAAV